MKTKTKGIVLHTTLYSESSLIVKIYTEQSGLESYIISGVRSKSGKTKSNLFQPLTLIELVASGKPGQNLKRITDVQLSIPFTDIPYSVTKSSIALFLSEVIYRSIKEEESNNRLFDFLYSSILILDVSPHSSARFHIYFMIQLSRYFGSYPHGKYENQNSFFDLREGFFVNQIPFHPDFIEPDLAFNLWQYMNSTFEKYHEISISDSIARRLLQAMVLYFELHFTHGQSIKSHKVLSEILN